ncbi:MULTISPECIES: RcnB family protein [Sphingomonas]|uniref:RcnB family protein n=1 Tax=Sphingomonas TaxID=13687 RepID=UPI0009EBBD98|nr:RcnB family protein [Sphingomonas sp. CCH10-B3]
MRKSFMVGLLAAVALLPGAALAQEEPQLRGRGQFQRNENGPRFQPSESRQSRDFRGPPQFQAQPQAQPQFQRPDRAFNPQQPPQFNRPDRRFNQPRADVPQVTIDRPQRNVTPPAFQGQPQVQDQPRPNRPDWRQNRGNFGGVAPAPQFRDQRPDFRADRRDDRQDFRNDRRDQRPDFRADRRDDRQDFRNDRRDDRQDFRRDFRGDQRYGFQGNFRQDFRGAYRNQPNYRGNGFYSNGYRGAWNRDWRRDNRWNWQSYRNYNRDVFRLPRYYAPYGWSFGYRRFAIGYTLNSILFDQRYWISDPYFYRLPEAYYPYEWVRYYDDALLVDVETGEVIDVVYGIFY